MDTLFTSVDKEANYSTKIDIDQLYERKQKSDLTKLDLYNKLLNRIHIKIKTISRIHNNQQWCWFCIPEVMIGSPKYNQLECISYIIEKLYDNGFNVKYINPNCLLISWAHWVPGYVRNEIKKKTGIVVDEYGNQLEENNDKEDLNNFFNNKQKLGENKGQLNKSEQKNKNYKPINSYKPIGNFTF
tara:strand:- start:22 stop:579 length:558 start_codon:yes stop_codon:yes gene_type:complete